MYVYFVSEIKSTLIFMCEPIVCRFLLRTITFQKCEVNCKSIDFIVFFSFAGYIFVIATTAIINSSTMLESVMEKPPI